MTDRALLAELVAAARAHLEWLRETGVETAPALDPAAADAAVPRSAMVDPGPVTAPPPPSVELGIRTVSTAPARDGDARPATARGVDDLFTPAEVRAAGSLPELRAAIGDCSRCKLAPHRTQLVFGVGNPDAELAFVGEAPGRDEDVKGEPFVGRAGQLLTEIIVKGMKLRREDVYIANIIKCRPPQNRNPEPDEIASCEPFLVRQLEIIRPQVIVALGTFAAQVLLKTRTPITRLRGVWADYHGIPLMPTFHPAYLLRNPGEKRVVWQDIQQVMGKLGLPR